MICCFNVMLKKLLKEEIKLKYKNRNKVKKYHEITFCFSLKVIFLS